MMWLYVALGGALGAMARFGLHSLMVPAPGKFPFATYTANVAGCFLMGIFYILIVEKHLLTPTLRPLIMVGFLGAFTTFSTFSIEALNLWHTQNFHIAVTYVVSSFISSLLAVWFGVTLCEKFIH